MRNRATRLCQPENLLPDEEGEPVDHPAISGMFEDFDQGRYQLKRERRH